jgi:zinc transport system substrate-binding protein
VDTAQGIERIPMAADHGHEEEGEGEHEGENLDPHIWTSPALVKVQAQTIYDALVQLDPEHEAAFKANLDAFLADIEQLEARIRDALANIESVKFLVFHPSWGYFARDFGLEMIAIEIEGKEPSALEMAQVIAEAKKEGIRVIFAQPELSTRSATTIATEIGGEVLLISPLAYDWLDNLEQVGATFAKVLGDS